MSLQPDGSDDAESIDLRQLFSQLWNRRLLIAITTLLFTVGIAIFAYATEPVYQASTVLLPSGSERSSLSSSISSALGSLGGLASLAGVSVGGNDSGTEEALAVLHSREFTQRYIIDKNLLPKLFSKKWDSAAGRWRVSTGGQPTPAKAFKYFDKKIRSISQDRKTNLVSLVIDWRDPNEAASWANELVQRLNSEMRSRAIAKADASLGFLEKELASTSVVETRDAINRLIETQVKQRMVASVSPEYAFRVVDAAMPPDADDPIWPKKMWLITGGALIGFVVGAVLALVLEAALHAPSARRVH